MTSVSGTDNCVADALSQIETNTLHQSLSIIDFKAITAAQQTDPELPQLQSSTPSIKLQPLPLPTLHYFVICLQVSLNLTYHNNSDKQCLTLCMHSLSHPSIRATQHLITSRYISGLTSTKICISGLDVAYNVKSKIHHHTTAPLGKFTTPDGRLANMTSLDPFHLLKDAFTYY